jgi:hypothetical protein
MREMHTELWLESMKGEILLEYLGVNKSMYDIKIELEDVGGWCEPDS